MGCSTSKLENEEAVQLCKDRKNFIKQALEHRSRFASGHIAYIQSLKRVSAALRNYSEGDEPREFFLDPYSTPSLKKTGPSIISISSKPFSTPPQIQAESNSAFRVNYLRSGGNPSISVEERPQSPETVRVESYPPMHHYGIDGFFAMQSTPTDSSFFSSPPNRPSFPPQSPQTTQWDFFWNPFNSLDTCGYPTRMSLDQTVMDDETEGLRQVREQEGIPDLEEELDEQVAPSESKVKTEVNCGNYDDDIVVVEDDTDTETDNEPGTAYGAKGLKPHFSECGGASEAHNTIELEISSQERGAGGQEDKDGTPGFTVYVNRRPTCMAEVIKDLEAQFMIVCNSANEVSTMLEATKAQYPPTSSELTAVKMLNPVALFHSGSSRSTSSICLNNSLSSRDDGYDSSSDISEESCMFSGSHQSTLDRLYAWEKKLYEEVKAGERVRLAYEKKCMQLRNQDVKGEGSSLVHKTRGTIRDLHTQIKVSIHSVEAVSKRIETLRDEELQPQLLELIQGLARMWKVMAECHRTQKRTIDEAKLLLASTPLKQAEQKRHSEISPTEPHKLARSAANLVTELRNWQACFESWITAQRSYVNALKGWLLRCVRTDPETSNLSFSPRCSGGAPPIFGICIQWSRFLDDIRDSPVIDGLDFFAAGVGSVYAQQLKDDSRQTPKGSKQFSPVSNGNMEVVEVGQVEAEEALMSAEKMAEVAIRVLCAGMSVVVSSLTEFAMTSTEGYADLVKQWENTTWTQEASKKAM